MVMTTTMMIMISYHPDKSNNYLSAAAIGVQTIRRTSYRPSGFTEKYINANFFSAQTSKQQRCFYVIFSVTLNRYLSCLVLLLLV